MLCKSEKSSAVKCSQVNAQKWDFSQVSWLSINCSLTFGDYLCGKLSLQLDSRLTEFPFFEHLTDFTWLHLTTTRLEPDNPLLQSVMFDQLTIWSFLTSWCDLYQMDVPELEASEQAPAPFLSSSEAGHALCRRILKELLPFEPQIEGILTNWSLCCSPHWFRENWLSFHVHASCIGYPKGPVTSVP